MNRIFRALAPFIALAVGVLFFVLGFHTLHLRKVYTETTAVITDIQVDYGVGDEDDEHEVYVSYTVDGTEYEEELDEYTAGMSVGDEVGIMYDPADPGEIISAGAFGVILQFVVGVLGIFGGVTLLFKRINGR